MKLRMRLPFFGFVLLCFAFSAQATHLRGGYISINNVMGLTYRITLNVFVKTQGTETNVSFSHGNSGILSFGDGAKINVPESQASIRLDLDPSGNTSEVILDFVHTYAGTGEFHVTYVEVNRNLGIVNFDNSVSTPFYLESHFIVDPRLNPYYSPRLLASPILKGLAGREFSYSLAAVDTNDYTLFYHTQIPKASDLENVSNYKLPENFKINPLTALVSWDTKFHGSVIAGEYAFAYKILQVKNGSVLGFMVVDFQLIISDNEIFSPSIADDQNLTNGRIYVPEESTYTVKVFAEDLPGNDLELMEYCIFNNDASIISFTVKDSLTEDNRNIKAGVMKFKSNKDIVRDNPYSVIIRASYVNNKVKYFKDLSYLIYTKDVVLTEPEIVAGTEAEIKLKIYPNPVADYLTIENVRREKMKIRVLSIVGNTMIEKEIDQNDVIDMRELVQGLYLVTLAQGNKHLTIRVLKK